MRSLVLLSLIVAGCATTPYVRRLPTAVYEAPPEALYDKIYRSLIPRPGRTFLNPEEKRILQCAYYEDKGGGPLTPARAKWPPDLFFCLHVQLVAAGDGWRVELAGQGKKVEAHRRNVPELEEMLTREAPPRDLTRKKEFLDAYDAYFAELLAEYASKRSPR
jgi:hypothetical protein